MARSSDAEADRFEKILASVKEAAVGSDPVVKAIRIWSSWLQETVSNDEGILRLSGF